MQVAQALFLATDMHDAGQRRAAAHGADGGGIDERQGLQVQPRSAAHHDHLHGGHHHRSAHALAVVQVLVAPQAGQQMAQCHVVQGLKLGQHLTLHVIGFLGARALLQMLDDGTHDRLPGRIDVSRQLPQRHGVALGAVDPLGVRLGHVGHGIQCGMLGVDQAGQIAQEGAHGAAFGQVAQACCALTQSRGWLGEDDARKGGAIEGFDLTRLENALRHEFPWFECGACRGHAGAGKGGPGVHGTLQGS